VAKELQQSMFADFECGRFTAIVMTVQLPQIDPLLLRNALGAFATGVTVITTVGPDGRDVGLTANSFNSVSLDPPLVLWSLKKQSASMLAFEQADHFAVHLLAFGQREMSDRFSSRLEDRFEGLHVQRGAGGVPLLEGCSGRFVCSTEYRYEGGDHVIFVGRVLDVQLSDRAPLLYLRGSYSAAMPLDKKLALARGLQAEGLQDQYSEEGLFYLNNRLHEQLLHRVRPTLRAEGFAQDADYQVCKLLAAAGGMTLAELAELCALREDPIDERRVGDLQARGLLSIDGATGRLVLTADGQARLAVVRQVETEALSIFSEGELAAVRMALRRLVAATDPGLPDVWGFDPDRG
jgi:3-hydroxy-9,10-secoandrosta-1,3,5(10)-triene-9,17-dione monooxygenase reductase component